jgi:cytochrome c553
MPACLNDMKTILKIASDRATTFAGASHRPVQRVFRLLRGLTMAIGASLFCTGAFAQQSVDTIAQRTVACAACHGKEGRATSEGYFPRIAGKPAGYLYNQLVNFREGRRRYPMMTYMVEHLSDEYLLEMAQYFSNLHPPYPAPQVVGVSPATLERGRTLVMSGNPSKNVPACIACHGKNLTGLAPAIPGLVGLPRDYLNSQFGAWKNGGRRAAAPDCMAQITNRLSAEDISAATAWLASQPVPNDMRPVPAGSVKLPIRCGSVSE